MIASLMFATLAAKPIPPFIAVDGYVNLAQKNGKWQNATLSFPSLKGPLSLTELGIGRVGNATNISRVKGSTKTQKAKLVGPGMKPGVLFYGFKPSAPRPFKAISGEKCRDWVSRWLKQGYEFKDRIDILSAYEGDLDGDGTKEQVAWGRIEFNDVSKPPISQAFLLRANGKIYPIYAWDHYEAEYSLKAVADIDGDGKMELITKLQSWGYSRATISFYNRGAYSQVPNKNFIDRTHGK